MSLRPSAATRLLPHAAPLPLAHPRDLSALVARKAAVGATSASTDVRVVSLGELSGLFERVVEVEIGAKFLSKIGKKIARRKIGKTPSTSSGGSKVSWWRKGRRSRRNSGSSTGSKRSKSGSKGGKKEERNPSESDQQSDYISSAQLQSEYHFWKAVKKSNFLTKPDFMHGFVDTITDNEGANRPKFFVETYNRGVKLAFDSRKWMRGGSGRFEPHQKEYWNVFKQNIFKLYEEHRNSDRRELEEKYAQRPQNRWVW